MRNKLLFALSGILALLCVEVNANNNITIYGHVIDKSTGEYISLVNIVVENTTKGTSTDDSGHFTLKLDTKEDIVLIATSVGYSNQTQKIKLTNDKLYNVIFNLEPNSIDMNGVVVTANRYQTKKREAATIVGTMSNDFILQTQSANIAQAMNFQPGARLDFGCQNCGASEVRINGLSGQYSQILLDSRPMFNSLNMVYGLEQYPASMIERVEVVRGGASVLYGSNAIAGTINIITREPITSSVELSNKTGLVGGSSIDFSNALNASVISDDKKSGAYIYAMSSQREEYDRNDDGFSEVPLLKATTLGTKMYRTLSNTSKLTLDYHYIHEYRRGGDSVELAPSSVQLAEQLEHSIHGGGLNYEFSSLDKLTNVSVYGAVQNTYRDSYFGGDYNPYAYGTTTDLTANMGAQYSYRYATESYLPATISAGVDYNYNHLVDKAYEYEGHDIDQRVNVYGLYAQNEWNNKKYTFLVGARLDSHSELENPAFIPRASVRYAPDDNWTLRASYAGGYRAPQVYDEDLHIGGVDGSETIIKVSDNLQKESSHTMNLSADYWIKKGDWQFNMLADGFYTRLNDVFVLESVEEGSDLDKAGYTYVRENAPGAFVAGVNLELRTAYLDLIDIQAGYTYQVSRYDEMQHFDGCEEEGVKDAEYTEFLRTPNHYGYVTVNYKPISQVNLSLSGIYTGSQLVENVKVYEAANGDEIEYSVINDVQDFFDMSFSASYAFRFGNSSLELSATVKNIFDAYQDDLESGAGRDAGYIYGPSLPRSVYVGVKYTF